jgi:hypothetical protein
MLNWRSIRGAILTRYWTLILPIFMDWKRRDSDIMIVVDCIFIDCS